MTDGELYRDNNEVEKGKIHDSVPQFEEFLLNQKWIAPDEILEMDHKNRKGNSECGRFCRIWNLGSKRGINKICLKLNNNFKSLNHEKLYSMSKLRYAT